MNQASETDTLEAHFHKDLALTPPSKRPLDPLHTPQRHIQLGKPPACRSTCPYQSAIRCCGRAQVACLGKGGCRCRDLDIPCLRLGTHSTHHFDARLHV
jgi:hypothetical protein